MLVLAYLKPLDHAPAERRGAPRLAMTLGSELGPCGSSVKIRDLSSTGLLFETSADLAIGETIEVHLPEIGAARARVARSDGQLFGCQFEQPIPRAAVSAALLRSQPDPQPLQAAGDERAAPNKRRIRGAVVAAVAVAGLGYLLVISGSVALAAVSALVLLIVLLVRWGFWVIDNTPFY